MSSSGVDNRRRQLFEEQRDAICALMMSSTALYDSVFSKLCARSALPTALVQRPERQPGDVRKIGPCRVKIAAKGAEQQ